MCIAIPFSSTLFIMYALNNRTADDGNNQAKRHIRKGNLRSENTQQQQQAAQINHGRRNDEEKVTPTGSPALVKPINSGKEEQEQNGVIVPSSEAAKLAPKP